MAGTAEHAPIPDDANTASPAAGFVRGWWSQNGVQLSAYGMIVALLGVFVNQSINQSAEHAELIKESSRKAEAREERAWQVREKERADSFKHASEAIQQMNRVSNDVQDLIRLMKSKETSDLEGVTAPMPREVNRG